MFTRRGFLSSLSVGAIVGLTPSPATSDPQGRRVVIHKDDRITDKHDGLVCIANTDIRQGDVVSIDNFDWFIEKPSPTDFITDIPGFLESKRGLILARVDGRWVG